MIALKIHTRIIHETFQSKKIMELLYHKKFKRKTTGWILIIIHFSDQVTNKQEPHFTNAGNPKRFLLLLPPKSTVTCNLFHCTQGKNHFYTSCACEFVEIEESSWDFSFIFIFISKPMIYWICWKVGLRVW